MHWSSRLAKLRWPLLSARSRNVVKSSPTCSILRRRAKLSLKSMGDILPLDFDLDYPAQCTVGDSGQLGVLHTRRKSFQIAWRANGLPNQAFIRILQCEVRITHLLEGKYMRPTVHFMFNVVSAGFQHGICHSRNGERQALGQSKEVSLYARELALFRP